MFAMIAIIVAGGIAALLGFAATKPDTWTVRRSRKIDAPPERIFPLIDDFHRWTEWSPWEKIDADLRRVYTGAQSGVGAVYEWEGKKAGAGRMEITESTPPSRLFLRLVFTRPFRANNTTEFVFTPDGAGTVVDWIMVGQNLYLGKVMGTLINMDRMVGKDFEKGLANLAATVAGASPPSDPSAP